MINKNDVLPIEITAMSNEGVGIGRADNFVVYVPASAVGDVVECKILKRLSSYAFGKIERILSPSPDRVDCGCAVFGKCGGCEYRHVTYEAELRYKKEAVKYAYRHAFGSDIPFSVADVVPSPVTKGYRNKVQYPITRDGRCGFFAKASHRTVAVGACALENAAFFEVRAAFEKWIAESGAEPYDEATGKGLLRHLFLRAGDGGVSVCVVASRGVLPCEQKLVETLSSLPCVTGIYLNVNARDTNVILGEKYRLLWGEKELSDTMCGTRMRVSPQSFYQINKAQAERLYAFALDAADIGKDDKVLDLYCGIGSITFAAARRAREAVGVEIVPEAVENARRAARENGIANVRFFASDANALDGVLEKADFAPTAVVVDPPRKGLDADTVAALSRLSPEKIVYISCNPMTQARDVRALLENAGGAYSLSQVTPFDMFPRTKHVETVVLLSRKNIDDHLEFVLTDEEFGTKKGV